MDIYKQALQLNLTFSNPRGTVGLAGLFVLPLQASARNAISLDGMYSDVMAEKAAFNTNSYLGAADNAELVKVDLKLAILKDIMDTKLAERAAASARADLIAERKALLAEQASRIAAAPAKLTDAELAAKLAKLEDV